MKNMFNWIEISVADFTRAKKFYEHVLGITMEEMDFGGYKMGFFPGYDSEAVSGAIVHGSGYEPSDKGTVVYFNCNPDLQGSLAKVEEAGGKVLQAKKQITEEYGYMALIVDTEGNRIALHSND